MKKLQESVPSKICLLIKKKKKNKNEEKVENFILKLETIKTYQVNTAELRNTVTEIKKLIDGFNTGLDTAKKEN